MSGEESYTFTELSTLEIDGVAFGGEYGLEVGEDREDPKSLWHDAVWLTRRNNPRGSYERIRKLPPDAQVVAKHDEWRSSARRAIWSLECNGRGVGVYRVRWTPDETA